MSVLTEAALRIMLKDEDLDALEEYRVASDVIVTPSAKAYLIDHRIDLIVGEKRIIKTPRREKAETAKPDGAKPEGPKPNGLKPDGAVTSGAKPDGPKSEGPKPDGLKPDGLKPEYMTALRGGELVFKDHKIIKLRGKVDAFEAFAMETQFRLAEKGHKKAAGELGDVVAYVRKLMRCEVLREDVPPMLLFGMDEAEIRERSHKPHKFYGFGHFMPITPEDGEVVLCLNVLRTLSREAELCAYEAFRDEQGVPERQDIVQAYNRLSSALYVMMLRAKANEYE